MDLAEFRSKVLDNPATFEGLRDFMIREFAEENILFYSACTEFKKGAAGMPKDELSRAAQKIFTTYVGTAALFEIALPQTEVKTLMQQIQNRLVGPNFFDRAVAHVASTMLRDVFPRFASQPAYRHLRPGAPQTKLQPTDPTTALRKSTTLMRSFHIATMATSSGGSFHDDFYSELFQSSPESKMVFQHNLAHQGIALQGALSNLLAFLKEDVKKFQAAIKKLSEVHLKMGITRSMFEAFGDALILTLAHHLQLDEGTQEWAAVERHWRAAYTYITQEIVIGMTQLPIEQRGLFAKKETAPKWLSDQLVEYKTYTSLTILLVSKTGNEKFMETFYSKFFEVSPSSKKKFKDMASQKQALWGALNSVIKLLEKPEKMRKSLAEIAKIHRTKAITHKEFMLFIRCLRVAFRTELGPEYTEQMDAVWKQFLELLILFLAEKGDESGKGERLTLKFEDLDPERKEDSGSRSLNSDKQAAVGAIYDALTSMQTSSTPATENSREHSESNSREHSSIMEPDYPLDLAFFRQRMPAGVPDSAIAAEVQKLNDQLIYSTRQLSTFTLQEVEAFVLPGAAKALAPFLAK